MGLSITCVRAFRFLIEVGLWSEVGSLGVGLDKWAMSGNRNRSRSGGKGGGPGNYTVDVCLSCEKGGFSFFLFVLEFRLLRLVDPCEVWTYQ